MSQVLSAVVIVEPCEQFIAMIPIFILLSLKSGFRFGENVIIVYGFVFAV